MVQPPLDTLVRRIRGLASRATPNEQPDSELLYLFTARNDEAAFAALVKRHGPLVLSVARRILRNLADAEDAFQATFLVLARQATSVRKQTCLAGWLHGVAYRIALNARRAALRRRKHEARTEIVQPTCPAWQTAWREVQLLLDQEIQILPGKYREPFLLCCLENKSCSQAAAELGLKEGTVWSRLAEARKRLRQRLERRGVALTAMLAAVAVAQDAEAALPAALMHSAVKLVTPAGEALIAAVAPARVLALARDMATALLLAKVKGGIVWLVIAGILTASLGFCTREALPETRPELVESIPVQELSRKEHHRSKPAEPGRPRTDSYGDPIPEGARARLGTVRFRDLTSPTAQLIYAGGGKVLISAGMQFSGICAWDADSGRPRYRLTAPRIAMSLAVSPDGKSPFSQGDLGIFWGIDIATGKALRQFTPGIWGQAAFSSDGKTVAVAANDEWRVLRWDFATGKMLPPLAKDGEIGSAVAFSPDGKLMATASNDHSIRLWDSVTGKERHRLAGHDKPVYSLAFAASGKILASAGEGSTIRLWNLDTGKQLRLLAGEKGYNSRVVFSPDGRLLASTGGDGEFRRASVHIGTLGLWDPHTGKELHRWERIYAWAFSPDAKVLATTSPEGVIRRWDTVTYKEIDPPHGHVGRIWSLRFAADGKSLFSRLRWTSGGVGSDNRPATALVIRWINRIGKPLPMVR